MDSAGSYPAGLLSAAARQAGMAVLASSLRFPAGKRSFRSAFLNPWRGTVTPASGPFSHHLTTLSSSNALIVAPGHVTALSAGHVTALSAGQTVQVLTLAS
jgi:molybdopterin biosynthesis enzyme